jgi:hypothetical protein
MRRPRGSAQPPGVVFGDRPSDVKKPDEKTTSRAKEAFIDIFRKKHGEEVAGKKSAQ